MDKCYKLLHKKIGKLDSNCLKCSYWKQSVKNKTDKLCYEFFNCEEDCAFKYGKLPGQQRALKLAGAVLRKESKSADIDSEAFARALAIMMNEEKK